MKTKSFSKQITNKEEGYESVAALWQVQAAVKPMGMGAVCRLGLLEIFPLCVAIASFLYFLLARIKAARKKIQMV